MLRCGNNKVYVVFCIDTEGPVKGRLDSWEKLDEETGKLFSSAIRGQLPDTGGRGLILNWFIMDYTGYKDNPYGKVFGYGNIYEHYRNKYLNPLNAYGAKDPIYWHYHHPTADGSWDYGGWNKDWPSSYEYYNQLNRLIIDRKTFPSVFRAGGVIESNAMSAWLENWIPFDYSSRSGMPVAYHLRRGIKYVAKEAGKFILRRKDVYLAEALRYLFTQPFKKTLWDWSRAPKEWGIYHPAAGDYQRPGIMKRAIARCLDINSPAYQLAYSDVEAAFKKAARGEDTIFSCTTHDNSLNLSGEIKTVLGFIKKASARFPQVRWAYANALEAMQDILKYNDRARPNFELRFEGSHIFIKSDKALFSPAPYLVIKYDGDQYVRYDLEKIGEKKWQLSLPEEGFSGSVGVAASDQYGNTAVYLYHKTKEGLNE